MLLSEAIRVGAKLTRPLYAELFDRFPPGGGMPDAACAMGAALVGFSTVVETPLWYGMSTDRAGDILSEHVGIDLLDRTIPMPPAYWESRHQVGDMPREYAVVEAIWRMNDRTTMTREEIADWLAQQGL